MRVEVLVATVNADVKNLIKNMNIQSDAIIINQCNENSYYEFKNKNRIVKVYNFAERGVGLSRNNALMRASADIVLFADDDEVLVDNYENIIIDEFQNNAKADMLVFSIDSTGGTRDAETILAKKKLNKYNCLKYGAVRFAVKLNMLRKNNISFSLLFGGGCQFGSGEDSIFIYDCLKKKIKVFTSTKTIACVDFSTSSWFKGYNKKFYFDKGALFYCLHGYFSYLFIVIYLLRHKFENNELSFLEKFNLMRMGYLIMKEGNIYEKKY